MARELAAQIRADPLLRAGVRRSASSTTNCAQHYRDALLQSVDDARYGQVQNPGSGGAAAAAPGRLPSGPDRPKRQTNPARNSTCCSTACAKCVAEGHKALVFSQFTSLLAIVRERLDAAGMVYEYLDGATRDRQEQVERFQNDAGCPLFLISLKGRRSGPEPHRGRLCFSAGPVVESGSGSQAIDRAHRIGQTHQVFAYRLIREIRSRKRFWNCRAPNATWPTPSSARTTAFRELSAKIWNCCFLRDARHFRGARLL